MTNDITPIIIFLFIVLIYCVAVFYKINDRVLFYEALDQGDVYNVYIEDRWSSVLLNEYAKRLVLLSLLR